MRKLTFLLLVVLLPGGAFSQSPNDNTPDKKTGWHNISYDQFVANDTLHRWQVGLNTQFFTNGLYDDANDIFDSSLTPIEILVRRQTTLNQAIRLRVFGMNEKFKRDDGSTKIETNKSIFGLALGYEWQMLLGKRWKLYYGFEIEGKRLWDNTVALDKSLYQASTGETFKRTVFRDRTTNRISLLPLAGIRFHITPRFFVSTEMKMEVFYEKFRSANYPTLTRLDGSLLHRGSTNSFIIENKGINFQPYTGIYLNLTF